MVRQTREQQLAAAEAKAARLRHQIATANRKADTRRKIVVGSIVIATMKHDPDFATRIVALLHQHVARDPDRAAVADLLDGKSESATVNGQAVSGQ